MRAITLTQPRATLVAIGAQQIETRSWATKYRGPLAIHAAAGLGPIKGAAGLRATVQSEPFRTVFAEYDRYWCTDVLNDPAYYLPRGAIVATCELVDCRPTDEPDARFGWTYVRKDGSSLRFDLTDQERAFGNYTPGRYAWLLANVQRLPEPIPARGQLGLWNWEEVPA